MQLQRDGEKGLQHRWLIFLEPITKIVFLNFFFFSFSNLLKWQVEGGEIKTWDRIHNALFSTELTNGPNKLERLSLKSLSRFVQCNTPACWTHL